MDTNKIQEFFLLRDISLSLQQRMRENLILLKETRYKHDIQLNLEIQNIQHDMDIINTPLANTANEVYTAIEKQYGKGKTFKFLKVNPEDNPKNGTSMTISTD